MQQSFAELQTSIVSVTTRVNEVDIRQFEGHPPEVLAAELAPRVRALLSDAYKVVSDVVIACEGQTSSAEVDSDDWGALPFPPIPYVPFERALDNAIERRSDWSLAAVGDIGFLAGLELRQRADRLGRLVPRSSHQAIIGECDSALRRIRKAMTTIDRALARAGVTAPRLDFASELETSLEVRRVYAKLRARVKAVGEPRGETFYVQLRSVGTAIATVVGWKGYPNLRVRDRLQMRELQRRLLEWFRAERDPVAGHHLWQDIDYFVQMLADVNRRQELREHDANVVEKGWMVVSTTDGEMPAPILEQLQTLEGLDDEVDGLLASERRFETAAWQAPIHRLRMELSVVRALP